MKSFLMLFKVLLAGKVVIPEIEDVVDWFQLKYNYETVLEKKAHNQLNGVLPRGSYKVAVTIDLSSVTKTGAPNINKIITSVVIDEQFDEVELNDETMESIKQSVAGAIGYEDGRDQIHISKAGFLPKRAVMDESSDDLKKVVLPKNLFLLVLSERCGCGPFYDWCFGYDWVDYCLCFNWPFNNVLLYLKGFYLV